jgi:hypothetical protein
MTRYIRLIDMDGWLLAVAGEQPGTVMADLCLPALAFGRQGPGVADGPADPLGELLIGFEVIGADTQPSPHFPAALMAGVAVVVSARVPQSAGSTRIRAPPLPLALMAMLPPIRNARPPNIFFSASPGPVPIRNRIRSASSVS